MACRSIALLVGVALFGDPPDDGTRAGATPATTAAEAPEPGTVAPAPGSKRRRGRARGQGPEGPEAPPALGDLSARGTDNGALELGLGATSIVVTGALIAHGIYQIFEARRKAEICLGRSTDPPECTFDGPNLRYAGAGLSFGFAVPVAVGAGLFLRKGVRINRDYKAYRQANPAAGVALRIDGVSAWARTRGDSGAAGGLRLRLSF